MEVYKLYHLELQQLLPTCLWAQNQIRQNLAPKCLGADTLMALQATEWKWVTERMPEPMLQVFYQGDAVLCHASFHSNLVMFAMFIRSITGIGLITIVGNDGMWRLSFDRANNKWIHESLYEESR
jgi:hypothetical protein